MTQFVEQRYPREKHMTTKCGEPEISISVLFEFRHHVISDFDMGAITGATESRWYAALTVIQVGDYYMWIRVPQQGASDLRQVHRTELTEIRCNNQTTDE